MFKDINGVTIEIGDIVKIENSPIKTNNATYIVCQDGTSDFYSGEDLTLYKVSKHNNGYSLSRSLHNICFYPLHNYSNKFNYSREKMSIATIEVLIKNDPEKVEIVKADEKWEYCEEDHKKDLFYRCDINIIDGKQIEDVSYLCSQVEKLQSFLSNLTLKSDEEIEIIKCCNSDYYYTRTSYNAIYKSDVVEIEAVKDEKREETNMDKQEEIIKYNSSNRKYYSIDEKLAYYANTVNSFREYKKNSATETYKYYCDKVYNILDKIKIEKPSVFDKAVYMVNRYCKKLAEYYNSYYANESSCPSVMICGGSNFPVRKKEKQNSRRNTLMETWNYLEGYSKKIEYLLTQEQPILSSDTNAIELLENKIKQLEEEHKHHMYCNNYYKKYGTLKGCEGLELSQIQEIESFIKRNPFFPPFIVVNDTANIRRYKQRLESLKKAKETVTSEDAEQNELFKVVKNSEIMRLQLLFDGKPSEEIRSVLKKHGFRWSPKNSAWQRQLTENSLYSLKNIKKELNIA